MLGTFDHLNLRLNGPEFHLELLNGDHSWDSPKVRSVFAPGTSCCPTTRPTPWAGASTRRRRRSSGARPG